jgi:hypothetical protein
MDTTLQIVPAENRVLCKKCKRPKGMHLGFKLDGTMFPGQETAIIIVCLELLPTFEPAEPVDTIDAEPE